MELSEADMLENTFNFQGNFKETKALEFDMSRVYQFENELKLPQKQEEKKSQEKQEQPVEGNNKAYFAII